MSEFFENPFGKKDDDFLKSPAEAPVHRKVLLEDKNISSKKHRKRSTNYARNTMTSSQKTVVT